MTKLQNNDRVDMTNLQAIDQCELAQIEGGFTIPKHPLSPVCFPENYNPILGW